MISTSSVVSLDLAVVYSEGVFQSKKSAAYQVRAALSSPDLWMIFVSSNQSTDYMHLVLINSVFN